MTHPGRPPARRRHRQASLPPNPKTAENGQAELAEPYDLPDPENHWLPGRAAYVVVVDQLRDWRPAEPPSLAELLETRTGRTREPEPDREAEP